MIEPSGSAAIQTSDLGSDIRLDRMPDHADVLSVRARKTIFGLFGLFFAAGAGLRLVYGDILFPLFLGVFATIAFTLRWMSGKWWAEL